MHQLKYSAPAETGAPALMPGASRTPDAQDTWDGRERAAGGNGPAGSAEAALRLAEDHDRIARRLNNVVIRRLFAAGLDLQAALGLLGEHSATPKICHAVDELDQAIRDIRDTIFDSPPGDRPPP